MVRFDEATPEDAAVLAEISKRAFDNDVHYGAPGPGGPGGYDSAEFQVSVMNSGIMRYYKMLSGNTIIGGFWVWIQGDGKYNLGRIFIEPEYQNQGIGTQAMEYAFQAFPDAKVWTLDTPEWNLRTRHFYEKVGFKVSKIENGDLWFEKKIAESPD